MAKGSLTVKLTTAEGALPVRSDNILVKDTKGNLLYRLATDENGVTPTVTLEAPDRANSLTPNTNKPRFSVADVEITADGFQKEIRRQVEIFDGVTTILPVNMLPVVEEVHSTMQPHEIVIPLEHGVDFNRTIQDEKQPLFAQEIGVNAMAEPPLANEVRIPEYVTVHLGSPNSESRNVRVRFIDYVKNVASSEIFPTWEDAALRANIHAQVSFVLNRIYTLWYRSRGFNFDMTSYRKNLIGQKR